jgi:hypothetical protein
MEHMGQPQGTWISYEHLGKSQGFLDQLWKTWVSLKVFRFASLKVLVSAMEQLCQP